MNFANTFYKAKLLFKIEYHKPVFSPPLPQVLRWWHIGSLKPALYAPTNSLLLTTNQLGYWRGWWSTTIQVISSFREKYKIDGCWIHSSTHCQWLMLFVGGINLREHMKVAVCADQNACRWAGGWRGIFTKSMQSMLFPGVLGTNHAFTSPVLSHILFQQFLHYSFEKITRILSRKIIKILMYIIKLLRKLL